MTKIIVNFDLLSHQQGSQPSNLDQDERLSYLYWGGKELHDLSLDTEIGFLCDILKAIATTGKNTIVGRLDADRNRQFAEFLHNNQKRCFLLEGGCI